MSPVGHTLTGQAIGYLALPKHSSKQTKICWLGVTAVIANAPDWPLPNWGHDRYDISHSIFSTAIAASFFVSLTRLFPALARVLPLRLALAGVVAWFSHLLLDTFYNHGNGLAMFWPISEGRIALPIACFETLRPDPLMSIHNLKVVSIEGIACGLLLLGAICGKLLWPRNKLPTSRSES